MATIVEFTIPAEDFLLQETLERRPETVFRIDSVIAHDVNYLPPFVWASRGDFERLTAVLAADSSVTDVELLTTLEEKRLYRTEWAGEVQLVRYVTVEHGATVQTATAHDEQWDLRVLFPRQDGISATNEYAHRHGYHLDITRLYDIENVQNDRFDLTENQRETLVAAVEHDFFDIPRGIEQAELAEKLGISHQALSERLRRAFRGLAEHVVLSSADDVHSTRDE